MERTALQNRVRAVRAERGLSQEQLAALVGVSRQTICSIETRQYCPSTLLAFQLARQLRVPVGELFALEEDDQ
jgi:putative transcriptional regulator